MNAPIEIFIQKYVNTSFLYAINTLKSSKLMSLEKKKENDFILYYIPTKMPLKVGQNIPSWACLYNIEKSHTYPWPN